MYPRLDSRAMTRFTNRSTFDVAIGTRLFDGRRPALPPAPRVAGFPPKTVPVWLTVSRRRLHAGDQPLDPLVDRTEGVLAQHGPLRLVVELEVHPVDGEVAAGRLGGADELATQPRPGGLRRIVNRLRDVLVGGDAGRKSLALQQIKDAAPAFDVVVGQVQLG